MNLYTTRYDDNVTYSIRMPIEFTPITQEQGEKLLPLIRQANGKYGFIEPRLDEGMCNAVLLTIVDKKYKMKSKLQDIRNEVGKSINEAYAKIKG
jgi:hypothetical protein